MSNHRIESSAIYLKNLKLKQISQKKGIFHPRDVSELQLLIQIAKEHGATIRTFGAQHSPPASLQTGTSNSIYIALDGEFRKIHSIKPDDKNENAKVVVGAGCYLGVNPQDKTSSLENSFNHQVHQQGFALPTLGGISHQTIAGFLQTSSSGGSALHGIADVIEEIKLIDGNGKICCYKKGTDEFNAAVVSMGLMGIIYEVTFNLPKTYLVEGLEENKELKDSLLAKNLNGQYNNLEQALFEQHEYAHINWFPQSYLERAMQWTGKAVASDLPLTPYNHPLKSSFLNFIAATILSITNLIEKIGGENTIAQKIKSFFIKPFVNLNDKQQFRDLWYRALPIDDQADVDYLIKTWFSEMWFPRDQMNLVMQKLENLFAKDKGAQGNFVVELYAAKNSPYWMSPGYNRDSFRVDLYWWAHNFGAAHDYFAKFWAELLSIPGARLHPGKVMPRAHEKYGETLFDQTFWRNHFPKFDEWLALREKHDPEQIFVNDYWRQMFNLPYLNQDKLDTKKTTILNPSLNYFAPSRYNNKKNEANLAEQTKNYSPKT